MGNDNKITKDDLKALRKEMKKVNMCHHFTRNKPEYTKRFYYDLKSKVGLANWKKCDPEIRLAWEEAANSFDMQYCLVTQTSHIENSR